MKIKLKPTEEILLKLLRKEFMREIADNPLSIAFVSLKKPKEIESAFEKWLIENEFVIK